MYNENNYRKEIDKIEDISVLQSILINDSKDIKERMNALFKLRTIGNLESVKALESVLLSGTSSDLVKHEVCYCFGQMLNFEENKIEIENFLNREVFEDPKRFSPIVLHEAAEALGNISSDNNIKLLERFLNYEDDIIRETCEISVENLNWMKNTDNGLKEGLNNIKLQYNSNDPAPPFNYKDDSKYNSIEKIRNIMHNKDETYFNRYRALFTLREFNSDEAVKVLCESFDKKLKNNFSALFKHEVAFILGQMCEQAKSALNALEQVLQDEEEDPIVRHEAALTLGEITKSKDLLNEYSKHENQLVAESCQIALDFVDYWNE